MKVTLVLLLAVRALNLSSFAAGADRPFQMRLQESYGKVPLSFEANHGQAGKEVRFLARGSGYHLLLTGAEAVLIFQKAEESTDQAADGKPRVEERTSADRLSQSTPRRRDHPVRSSLRLTLVSANPAPIVSGVGELPGKINYFLGNDPARWRTNVSTFAKVRYQEVYPGVDLVYYGDQRQLEFDFIVAPYADPKRIKLSFDGAEQVEVDAQGDLILRVGGDQIRFHKPLVYQEAGQVRQQIPSRFVVQPAERGHGELPQQIVGFEMAGYDRAKPLIIDPVLVYSTYLGGSLQDEGNRIAVDAAGNAYVAGYTDSVDFPTASPLQPGFVGEIGVGDIFVTKLSSNGTTLIYSTYIGGSFVEYPDSRIAVDAEGNVYLAGTTASTNFPVKNAIQTTRGGAEDAFVTKINNTGSALVYSTYLGGVSSDAASGIAVDAAGNAYLVGYTISTNFPTKNPLQGNLKGGRDLFVTKLNPQGSAAIFSTFLGGSADDYGNGIAVDGSGDIYVTGRTLSTNYPTANAIQSTVGGGFSYAFVTKIGASGAVLIYSTYVSGSVYESSRSIAVDSSGNAYITGFTFSTNFPVTVGAFQTRLNGDADIFVTKLNASGSAFAYSTLLGGSGIESGANIVVDSTGNAFLTGDTSSTNFPIANPIQAAYAGGASDAFVAVLDPAGSALLFSTYLGGSTPQESDIGKGIAIDTAGNIYVTGLTTSYEDPALGYKGFPVVNAFQPGYHGTNDAFVLKIRDALPPIPLMPTLAVRSLGNNRVEVSWPANATGFVLQATGPISPPRWANVLDVPPAVNGRVSVTNPSNVPILFFRLQK